MENVVDIKARDLADAIIRSVISVHAVPGGLHADDHADRYGVQTQYGTDDDGKIVIKFSFVTKEDCLVTAAIDAEAYLLAPDKAALQLHQSIRKCVDKHLQDRTPIILPDRLGRTH